MIGLFISFGTEQYEFGLVFIGSSFNHSSLPFILKYDITIVITLTKQVSLNLLIFIVSDVFAIEFWEL